MFVVPEDFKDRPYRVPNQNESPEFGAFIEAEEEKVLIKLLGYGLYKLFLAAIAESVLEVDPVALPERYSELRDGAEYEYNEKLYKYGGLVPFLKPYIYSLWMQQGTYKFVNGMVQNLPPQSTSGSDVSVNVDIEEFRVQAWNDFVRLIGTINSINSGWVGWNACGSHVNTFYGFMQSREDEWVDEDGDDVWEFSAPSLQNRLGL